MVIKTDGKKMAPRKHSESESPANDEEVIRPKVPIVSSQIDEYVRSEDSKALWVTRWPGGVYDEVMLKKWYDTGVWRTGDKHFNSIAPWWKKSGKSFDEIRALFAELMDEHFWRATRALERSYYDDLEEFKESLSSLDAPYAVRRGYSSMEEWYQGRLAMFSECLNELNAYRKFLGVPQYSPDPFLSNSLEQNRAWGLGQALLDEMRRHEKAMRRLSLLLKVPGHYMITEHEKKMKNNQGV